MIPVVVRGSLLWFIADPLLEPAERAVRYVEDGGVLCRDGLIVASGPWTELRSRLPPDAVVRHYPKHLVTAGFVDSHVHYPQLDIVGSPGGELTEWLDRYAYPEERRFDDADHARAVADRFCTELLRNGTTTALCFCTSHPTSVDALFAASTERDMRMIAGKVLMDRGGPDELLDTAERGWRESAELLARWHGTGRNGYAITPRFAPGCSSAQLEAAGALWREHPDALVHTHIAETESEVAEVTRLFGNRSDYYDVYDHSGLTGRGAVFAHGVHLSETELIRCYESDTALVHCPTSNLYLGSGLFDLRTATLPSRPIVIGLGSDVGAGPSLSLPRVIHGAYQVARLRDDPFDAVHGFYLATLGGARALGLADRIGSLVPGREADLVVLDPAATPMLARRSERAQSLAELLFALAVLGDDRMIRSTYVAGERLHWREPED
ncbi:MAG TPA: guanine deaminase [Pseudonocardiaceae bacterium]|nr:guanine deaminase [Pseudonocardiaceae bacterium]